jgi:hypothetical protein
MANPSLSVYGQYAAATQANLKPMLISVLMSPAAQKIDFWLNTIHVNGAGLKSVVREVTAGRIGIKLGPVMAGAGAEYGNGEKAFTFPNAGVFTSQSGRKIVVHESVHAMQDVAGGMLFSERGSIFTKEAENEAAAYVAGALFDIYSGVAPTSKIGVYVQAAAIADSIKNKPNAAVDTKEADVLRLLICAHPVYMFSQSHVDNLTPTFANGMGR